jgi:hypothetical protein
MYASLRISNTYLWDVGLLKLGPPSLADSDMPASPGAGLDPILGDIFARAAG